MKFVSYLLVTLSLYEVKAFIPRTAERRVLEDGSVIFKQRNRCGANEVWAQCPPAYYGDGCVSEKYLVAVTQGCAEQGKCICNQGFFRQNKTCVSRKDCKPFDNIPYENFAGE